MTQDRNLKLLLTVREVAQLTGLSVNTLYHYVSQKRIPVVRLSRRCIRFSREQIEAWIASMSEPARSGTQRVRKKSLALPPG